MTQLSSLMNASRAYIFSFRGRNTSRLEPFSFALASAIHTCLHNAYNQSQSQDEYTPVKYRMDFDHAMSLINGVIQINADLVWSYSDRLHKLYSSMLSGSMINIMHSSESAIADFFGISQHIDQETLIMLSANYTEINRHVGMLITVLPDLGIYTQLKDMDPSVPSPVAA